jgi:ribosomal protein S18 acetylase RimI-like enzyme
MWLSVRKLARHEWRIFRDLRLRALADAPDAFARTLAEEELLTDEDWLTRLDSRADSPFDLPLVVFANSKPAGCVWGRIEPAEPEVAYLYSMWVAPEFRCLGAGRMLADAIIAWAREANARRLVLDVTDGDTPAMRLYARLGFRPTGEALVVPGRSPLRSRTMQLALAEAPVS